MKCTSKVSWVELLLKGSLESYIACFMHKKIYLWMCIVWKIWGKIWEKICAGNYHSTLHHEKLWKKCTKQKMFSMPPTLTLAFSPSWCIADIKAKASRLLFPSDIWKWSGEGGRRKEKPSIATTMLRMLICSPAYFPLHFNKISAENFFINTKSINSSLKKKAVRLKTLHILFLSLYHKYTLWIKWMTVGKKFILFMRSR